MVRKKKRKRKRQREGREIECWVSRISRSENFMAEENQSETAKGE
jgi:hypothetical protein